MKNKFYFKLIALFLTGLPIIIQAYQYFVIDGNAQVENSLDTFEGIVFKEVVLLFMFLSISILSFSVDYWDLTKIPFTGFWKRFNKVPLRYPIVITSTIILLLLIVTYTKESSYEQDPNNTLKNVIYVIGIVEAILIFAQLSNILIKLRTIDFDDLLNGKNKYRVK